jgi:alkylhydroperoxidase family enzyme
MSKTSLLEPPNIEEPSFQGKDIKSKLDAWVDPALLDLVRLRMAQTSRCRSEMEKQRLYLKMRAESHERLDQLKAWRKASCFSPKERAALALGEAIAFGSTEPAMGQLLEEAQGHFAKEELIALLLAIMPPTDWRSERFKVLHHVTSKLIYLNGK